jgi:hypothetical protein
MGLDVERPRVIAKGTLSPESECPRIKVVLSSSSSDSNSEPDPSLLVRYPLLLLMPSFSINLPPDSLSAWSNSRASAASG